MSHGDCLLDCVSAKELLQALSTLNHITDESATPDFQLSFSETKNSFQSNQANTMDFQMYMARRNNNKQQRKHTPTTNKSITPKKVNKTPIKSPITKNNKSPKPTYTPRKQTTLNKQNQPQKKQTSSKICNHSKKIMSEKEKNGQNYVPIHLRTSQVLKSKQEKMVKLQKMQQTYQEIENKECTFKPTIQKYHRKENGAPKNRHKDCGKGSNIEEISYSTVGMSLLGEKSSEWGMKGIEMEESRQKSCKGNEPTVRKGKYKNEKFNMLLDLIN